MRPHFCILFSIAFSAVLAYGADVHEQPEAFLRSNWRNELAEFMSLFNPANIVDKIQDASFSSNLFDIPPMVNSGEVQPEAQTPPHTPDSGPELLQRSLKTLLSEKTKQIMQSFETVISSTVASGMGFHDVLEFASSYRVSWSDGSFIPLIKKVAQLVAIACDDFRARFPLPATAPGHAARMKRVSEDLERLQQLVIRLARDHAIEQKAVERHLTRVKPFLHDVGVLIGDVAELYPAAIEALVLNMSAVLLPEAIFLRSLVILYCFGPYVLGKDAISGWLLKHVSEDLRV